MANINWITVLLLGISNLVMLYAWYGHLRNMSGAPIWKVILVSWLIALVEYFFMIPANRIGFQGNGGPFSLMQLKVIQEAVTLTIFTIIVMFVFGGESLRWNHIVAFLLLIGAVYLMFLE